MKAIFTVGIPGSGKTTKYEKLRYLVINRDDIREKLFGDLNKYKFTKDREKQVTDYQKNMIEHAARSGLDIAITDTNLNQFFFESLVEYVESFGYEVEYDNIYCSYETAVKRDLQRNKSVGSDVIWTFFKKYNEQYGIQKVVQDDTLTPCYIFDIDGTLALMSKRSPFDWHRVSEDSENTPVCDMARLLSKDHKIIVLSGRDSVCRQDTIKWLDELALDNYELYMRPEGSQDKDFDVKYVLFNDHIKDKYFVKGVFDDRPQVCRLWNLMGLPLFKVGDQSEF